MKSKDKYHHGDLRNALVAASLSIIKREGAEALTLRSAAREAGVSHAAPYAHFEDKEDLIAAVKDEGFKELLELLKAERDGAGLDPTARLKRVGEVYLRFAHQHAAKYHIMFRRPLAKMPRADAHYIQTGQLMFKMMAEEVTGLYAKRPPRRKFTPEQVVICSWAALHGLCSLWIDGPMSHIVSEATTFDQLSSQFLTYILSNIEGA